MSIASSLLSFAITFALFGVLSGSSFVWGLEGPTIFPSAGYASAFALLLAALSIVLVRGNIRRLSVSPTASAAILVGLFFTDWLVRRYSFFQGPSIRGELFTAAIILFVLRRFLSERVILYAFIAACTLLFAGFLARSHGRPIITDDHASFIFRITLLKQYFPHIPLYHPLWNAGLDARDFFATGSLNFFLLNAPFFYLFDVTTIYSFTVGLLLFVYFPLSIFWSTKFLKGSTLASSSAAIVGLSGSLVWYRWALKYGTMGFITSASLCPLVFSLSIKLLNGEKLSRLELALLVISTSLMLSWIASGIIVIPLALIGIIRFRQLFTNSQFWIAAILIAVLVAPQAAILWRVSKVNTFLTAEGSGTQQEFRHRASDLNSIISTALSTNPFRLLSDLLRPALKVLRETANSTNPLICLLAIPGLFLLPRASRSAFIFTGLVLLVCGTVLVPFKPQLELDRMLVLLTILLCIPAGTALAQIFTATANRGQAAIMAACFAFVVVGPLSTSNIIYNRSLESYSFASELPHQLEATLIKNARLGRIVFSGFSLHELDGGHLAPLSVWTSLPLVASSPFHNRWKYTSVFPEYFLSRQDEGVTDFLNLMNAELVVAHEAGWRHYFAERPDRYESIEQIYPYAIFKRKDFISSYFLDGKGEVLRQENDRIVLKIDSEDATIKFNYFPFLKISGCEMSGKEVAPEINFIKLKKCIPGTEVTIQAVSSLKRLMSS